MLRRRPFRLASVVAKAARSGVISGHNVISVTDNGSAKARVTTALPHGLAGTEVITLTADGVYNNIYDGNLGGFTVVSARIFDLSQDYSVDFFGGRWD